MYIETRHFDNVKAMARLHKCEVEPKIETSKSYDSYINEIDDLQKWIEDELCIELDDIAGLVLTDVLDSGKWADITNYC